MINTTKNQTIEEFDRQAHYSVMFYSGYLAHAAGLPQPSETAAAEGWQTRVDDLKEASRRESAPQSCQ